MSTLPEPNMVAAGHTVIRPVSHAGPRILVAEDSPEQTALIRTLLDQMGDLVETVEDGAAGLARAREASPDPVITDVLMPELDGLNFSRRLREDPATRFLPVVVLKDSEGRAKVLPWRQGRTTFSPSRLAPPSRVPAWGGSCE